MQNWVAPASRVERAAATTSSRFRNANTSTPVSNRADCEQNAQSSGHAPDLALMRLSSSTSGPQYASRTRCASATTSGSCSRGSAATAATSSRVRGRRSSSRARAAVARGMRVSGRSGGTRGSVEVLPAGTRRRRLVAVRPVDCEQVAWLRHAPELAQAPVLQMQMAADVVGDGLGDEDLARLGFTGDPSGEVDDPADEIAGVVDRLAGMHADAEAESQSGRGHVLDVGLEFDRAQDRVVA